MPKTRDDMPSTIARSPEPVRRMFEKVHDSAVEQYGEGQRAHRTAFAALKHKFEKVGDHWEPKQHGKGPSDPRSTRTSAEKRAGKGETFGGVDFYGHSRKELYERARQLGITGRSRMSKADLARAIARKQH